MSSSPWAQAVEAMKLADACERYVDCGHHPELCDDCLSAMLRAALPHLLRAVVGAMTDDAAIGVARHIAAADPRPQGMAECADLMRTALLSALTDAAGRIP